ncbi:unnamed protein product [Fraxinus pennsylvanica]|uniref:Receptor-like serine/threonine-protein kinase n=1 Tax=Fraxinus pennsylvanica TaxID=56036 RepID=A0AAD1ZFK4_9LAMI|nr:unnamed protein product [Fraxinus pennsylvanica]
MPPSPFLVLSIYLLNFLILSASKPLTKPIISSPNSTHFSKKIEGFAESTRNSIKLESLQRSQVILSGNKTIFSENRTFQLGFFTRGRNVRCYLGIGYASIPTPTYVWVANRENPIKNLSSATAEISENGKLVVVDQDSRTILWETSNVEKASDLKLLEQGNLVLLNEGKIVWQSFDFPTDTWLPGMNLTTKQWLTSWKSSSDPAPGRYSVRLNPPYYGEIALVYSNVSVGNSDSNSYTYWTTGKWNGNSFDGVPEMTIPYIYKFEFVNPFTPMAVFGYTEVSIDKGVKPPLTRFVVDHTGQLKQFTWSFQTEYWNMFWSQPENPCRVYGLCGNLGLCSGGPSSPCKCLNGFRPVNDVSWNESDFSEGCHLEGDGTCGENKGFKEVGVVSYEGPKVVSFSASRSKCESECLSNCSCVGLLHNVRSNLCKNLYGSLFNIWNLTLDSTIDDKLYVKVQRNSTGKKNKKKMAVFIGMICGILVILSVGTINLLYLRRRKIKRRKGDDDGVFPVTNLRVFSYKELHAVTGGFSEKLGHGGFGAVFRGELSDSSLVAVKRLERPGGGEKEFRAELIGRDYSRVLATMRGTWGYVAPEWISGVAITTKADVYSYGMTLLELLGGRRNVEGPPSAGGGGSGDSGTEKWFFPPWAARQLIAGNVTAVVDERLSSTYDKAEAERVGLVAVWCIQDDESMRPTMGMVVKMLEGVVEVAVPPPPKLIQALVSGDSFRGVGDRVSHRDAPGSSDDNVLTSIDLKDSQSSL